MELKDTTGVHKSPNAILNYKKSIIDEDTKDAKWLIRMHYSNWIWRSVMQHATKKGWRSRLTISVGAISFGTSGEPSASLIYLTCTEQTNFPEKHVPKQVSFRPTDFSWPVNSKSLPANFCHGPQICNIHQLDQKVRAEQSSVTFGSCSQPGQRCIY